MNAITRHPGASVALEQHHPAVPLPARAADHLRRIQQHAEARAAFAAASEREREGLFVGAPPSPPALTGAERAEVQRAADFLASRLQPISAAHLAAWLAPINAAVRNPQSQDEMRVRIAGLHDLLADLPWGAFTVAARRAMAPQWFPSAGEIRAAIEPGARRLRAEADTLRRLAEPPRTAEPEATAPAQRTPEEIAAVQAKARALMAEAAAPAGRCITSRALPLSDGAMLTHYRQLAAQGSAAAATRLAAMEQRMGLDA